MSNNDRRFEDTMHSINSTAKRMGFKNGLDWANNQVKAGKMSPSVRDKYEKVHALRNIYSHGHAMDIDVSNETLNFVQGIDKKINSSHNNNHNIHHHNAHHNNNNNRENSTQSSGGGYGACYKVGGKSYASCYNSGGSSSGYAPSLSGLALEIKQNLKRLKKLKNITYDDILDAAAEMIRRWDIADFQVISQEYGYYPKTNFWGKINMEKSIREFAEIVVSNLNDSELSQLMQDVF